MLILLYSRHKLFYPKDGDWVHVFLSLWLGKDFCAMGVQQQQWLYPSIDAYGAVVMQRIQPKLK